MTVLTTSEKRKRFVSGIQPTGTMHLGNFLGAVKHWVELQQEGDCFFFLADLHAISEPGDRDLRNKVLDMARMLYACGIETENLFSQMMIPQHAELHWLLTCVTRMGWLNRMTQFKDKGGQDVEEAFRFGFERSQTMGSNIHLGGPLPIDVAWANYNDNRAGVGVGLFTYPVLQAADILLYSATHVPVGPDQAQHLELVRDIANRFNKLYGETFRIPETVIPPDCRIMSLKDPMKKMSKSDPDDMTRINFTDSDDMIARKIKRAVSDSEPLPRGDGYSDLDELFRDRPAARSLLNTYAAVTDTKPYRALEQSVGGLGFGHLKGRLSDALVDLIGPIRKRYTEMTRGDALELLENGRSIIAPFAEEKMADIRRTVFGY